MEQGESGKKRQVNLPKTRFTVEDKESPLTKTVTFERNSVRDNKLTLYNIIVIIKNEFKNIDPIVSFAAL
jgi:hypothetical protein